MSRSRSQSPRHVPNEKTLKEMTSLIHEAEISRRFPLPLSDIEALLKSRRKWRHMDRKEILGLVEQAMDGGWLAMRTEGNNAYLATRHFAGFDMEFIDESSGGLVPQVPKRERDFYPAIRSWLEIRYRCIAIDVSEVGKRGYRRVGRGLVAVPDLVGVRYLAGFHEDDVEVVAMEVKTDPPRSQHLSEAFRYERFAEYSILAYDTNSLGLFGEVRELADEARRLGIGLLRFPATRTERGRFLEIQTPTRQDPDPTVKHEYLARTLNILRCMFCGTYHLTDDRSRIILSKRDDAWLQYVSGENYNAIRYVCESCEAFLNART